MLVDVEPGLMPGGRHVSKDGMQVDLFFVHLANMRESQDTMMDFIGEATGVAVAG